MPTRSRARATGLRLAAGLVISLIVSAGTAAGQNDLVPYYGKNMVRYTRFDWHVYKTEHFEIYYYPEIEKHLERVASYAESAYQQVSADLKHDLAFKVPMIIFKSYMEFEQQNVIPGAVSEGVAAFAESTHDRMLMPLDEPPDLLYRTLTHELAHVFQFDIIPQSLVRQNVPLWVSEGHADFVAGHWAPVDLATVRDAAVADALPKMTELEGYGDFNNPRLIYNIGHAAFEFIESRWGREGVRQFLFSMRKAVIGGGENAYEDAFKLKPDEFDQQFEKYLKDRFKPYRDKERPADFGRNLAPNPERSVFTQALTVEPSPSGDLFAVMTLNRRDREYDIVLVSSKDGAVVRNLTGGFDHDMGFDYLTIPGSRWNTVSWLSWNPGGDQLAYFVRTGDYRTLIIQNVVTGRIDQRVALKGLDAPESPGFSPGGRQVVFSALRDARSDIYTVDLASRAVTNLTNDDFADYGPVFSPDGASVVYMARVSGNEKLFRFELAAKRKTQLTFGTHDDAAARFLDRDTIVFPSTATDPSVPVEPEAAVNGTVYNLWTLNLNSGSLQQYTDSLGGTYTPVVMKTPEGQKIAFISYYKGDYGLHTVELKKPIHTAESADFGAPGPIIDFQAPLTHLLSADNKRRKGTFEKLFFDGMPPIALGVTSGGDVYGGTAVSFTDVLGDHRVTAYVASVQQYRSIAGSYVNLSRRFQLAVQGFSQTQFFYGQYSGLLYDPAYAVYVDRDMAMATRSYHGGSVFGIYPLDAYRRIELSGGLVYFRERYNDSALEEASSQYQMAAYGQTLFNDGFVVPFGVAFVQETTVFREFGPLSGNTLRFGYEIAPGIGRALSRQSLDLDMRSYRRLAGNGLLALRLRGFKSWGSYPDFTYFGGNHEMRGYDYLEFVGQNAVFANAELRFPFIEAMLTPIGVVGGARAVLFANIGGGWFNNTGYKFWTRRTETLTPIVGYDFPADGGFPTIVYGDPVTVSGFRLRDGRASFGFGLETFILGFPLHFDWSYRTLFNKGWEDLLFGTEGASQFRRARFQVWMGYDF